MEVLNIEKITECLAIIFGETFCNELIVIRNILKTAFGKNSRAMPKNPDPCRKWGVFRHEWQEKP